MLRAAKALFLPEVPVVVVVVSRREEELLSLFPSRRERESLFKRKGKKEVSFSARFAKRDHLLRQASMRKTDVSARRQKKRGAGGDG